MLLFSTMLAINDSMTKDDFIQLVIDWNQGSPHKENIIPGIHWNGERNIRYGNDKLWLAIEEYRNQNIIAIRYEKTTSDGIVWDTDYVMNFNEMKMAIRLDRNYMETALTSNPTFSTPHFITLLIEKDYLKTDGDLPILRTPILIDENNIGLLANIINGNSKYQLPVIYISKTYYDEFPVNIKLISRHLKGIAHVLVQKDGWLNSRLKTACNQQNEYHGAIGIYYPNQAAEHKRYFYRAYDGGNTILMKKVIGNVIQYCNSKMIDTLYTWQGVNNALLRDKLITQKEERLAIEHAKNESDALIESVDEDMKKLQQQIEELTRTNETLTYENQGLRAKLNSTDSIPLLYFGNEEEFYQGEIREIILDILEEKLKNTANRSRRADVLRDVLQNNNYQRISTQRKKKIKNILQDCKTISSSVRQQLQGIGFTITEDGKHYRLIYYGDNRYTITIAKTGSDWRGGKNNASIIINGMM